MVVFFNPESFENEEVGKMLERVDQKLQEMLHLPLITDAINTIRSQLPDHINFHTVEHTLDVTREAILFALVDNLSDREIELISIATAYHDVGYIKRPRKNEEIGAQMAAEAMRTAGYSEKEIQAVVSMIEDTEVRLTNKGLEQVGRSALAGYLLDADLSNFGRADFFKKRVFIFQDLQLPDWKAYLRESLQFIRDHLWKTPAAKNLREAQRILNVKLIEDIIASLK